MKTKTYFSRDFSLVVIGQIISLFGNAILRFALPLHLLRETHSPALFGVVTACSFLPLIFLSFLGGILADRVNKRNIMVALNFLAAGILLVLLLAIGKVPTVPLILLSLMLLYGISGAYQPAVQAAIPALVGREDILSASAIVNQVGSLAGLLGPILGGMLFGTFGIRPILAISLLCFAASALMELFIRIPFDARRHDIGVLAMIQSDLRESSRYLRQEKPILMKIIGLIALFNLLLTAMLVVGTPILIVQTLHRSDAMLGLSQGILALGGLCGGILTAAFSRKWQRRSAPLLLFLCSLSVAMMALPLLLGMAESLCFGVLTAASFVTMALATLFSVQMLATVQMETPPALVGKVIALMLALSLCAQPIGQALYGLAFGRFPQHAGAIVLCAAILSGGVALASRKLFRD